MQKFEDLTSGTAIRHILSIHDENTDEYHAVFMIVDVLEPDMQDYPSDINHRKLYRSASSSGNNEFNAYLSKDYISISKDFVNDPANNIIFNKQSMDFIHEEFQYVPSSDKLSLLLSSDEKESLLFRAILPKRRYNSFINIYRDEKRKAQKLIYEAKNEYLRKQIAELSLKHLDFDICRFPELFGDIVFVRHHPLLRDFDVRASQSEPGLLIKTSTANNQSCRINVRVTDKYHKRIYLQHGEDSFDAKDRMHLIHLDDTPSRIDVDVTDEDGTLILSYRNMTFIKSFVVNFAVESFNLVLNKGSDDEKVIPKFNTETSHISGKKGYNKLELEEGADTEAWKNLEDGLMVAFFDGDKSPAGQTANIARAHNILQRILNYSSHYLYVVDPYFEANNLEDYIYPLRSADVKIRILSSKELSVEKACALLDAIKCYNLNSKPSMIDCRLSRGEHPIMHDRYLIAEDKVWLMGCSFNDFGSRATTIVKIPNAAAKNIISATEKWWSSEELTCTLSSYAVRKEIPI